MNLDKLDLKILRENFDDEMITKIGDENVSKIMVYLEKMVFIMLKIYFCYH